MYNFPRREAVLMAMSFSYELQAQVLDAWTAAEASLVKADIAPPVVRSLIPDFENPLEAARGWIVEHEARLALTNEIKEAQPKIAFHDAVVADDTTYSLAEAAKLLHCKPVSFNRALRSDGYLMHNNVAYQRFLSNGLFVLKFTGFKLDDGSVAPATTRVTSKGITYLQKKFAVVK